MKTLLNFLGAAALIVAFAGCEEDEVLDKMVINGITTTELPDTNDDGEPWDSDGTEPDFFLIIKSNGTNLETTEIMKDTLASSELNFTEGFPISISNTRDVVDIDIWESDAGEEDDEDSDFVGRVSFIPDFYTDQPTIVQAKDLEDIRVVVSTSWEYK
ncbi:hypothetical protein [Halocola ammonii]